MKHRGHMTTEERILRVAYQLHREKKPIHRWSVYLRMVDAKCRWMTKDQVSQTLKKHKDVLTPLTTISNQYGRVIIYGWVGGDDYFQEN